MRYKNKGKENITSLAPTKTKNKLVNKKNAAVLTTIVISTFITFAAIQKADATTSPWTQTDWIGGTIVQ